MRLTADEKFRRSCDDCREFMYKNGRKVPRRGPPPPCRECPKIPLGVEVRYQHWDYAADFTPQMEAAYLFYKKCRAVGKFPDDELVTECAARFLSAEEKADKTWDARISQDSVAGLFEGVLSLGRVTRGNRR